jgi:hypothetical protein
VDIVKEEWTRINAEQLASTLETSAIDIALAVIESPGHPYPCNVTKFVNEEKRSCTVFAGQIQHYKVYHE